MQNLATQTNQLTLRRLYLGAYEIDYTNPAQPKAVHYVNSPAGIAAIVTTENNTHSYHYTYTDHLGSIVTVTNATGGIVAEQNFDAWGRHRNPTDWTYPNSPPSQGGAGGGLNLPWWLYRGYTGHEHLPEFGLINMNGRMYDPVLGRMLSADNYVQDASHTQTYNRYTYAHNNPLKFTDPDGENPVAIAAAVVFSASLMAYHGGVMSNNGQANPAKWDWKSPLTLYSVISGAISGGTMGYGIGIEIAGNIAAKASYKAALANLTYKDMPTYQGGSSGPMTASTKPDDIVINGNRVYDKKTGKFLGLTNTKSSKVISMATDIFHGTLNSIVILSSIFYAASDEAIANLTTYSFDDVINNRVPDIESSFKPLRLPRYNPDGSTNWTRFEVANRSYELTPQESVEIFEAMLEFVPIKKLKPFVGNFANKTFNSAKDHLIKSEVITPAANRAADLIQPPTQAIPKRVGYNIYLTPNY